MDPHPVQTAARDSLLLPPDDSLTLLDVDQFRRYRLAAEWIDRILADSDPPFRVLEVGCNVLNLLPRFLDPKRVRVTRCDTERFADDPDFVLIAPDAPLPFETEEFDAVVALEVLEHIPEDRRGDFIRDCLRVARHGLVLSCPDGEPEVRQAEEIASEAYRIRNGLAHPFLSEHAEYGLPREEDIVGHLRALGQEPCVVTDAPLDAWLPGLLLSETMHERGPSDFLRRALHASLRRLPGQAVPYRKFYVAKKGTQLFSDTESEKRAASPFSVAELAHHLATAGVEAMRELDGKLREQAREMDELRADLAAMEDRLARRSTELSQVQRHHAGTRAVLAGVLQSQSWRWTAPLRFWRRLLRPRSFDACGLTPWHEVERHPDGEPGHWISTGGDPQFLIPTLLPPGRVRIRLRLTTEAPTTLEVYADQGQGFRASSLVIRTDVPGRLDEEFFIRLRRPTTALRLDPLDVPGEFRLEELSVEPMPGPRALWHALSRGVGPLLRGGFAEAVRNVRTAFDHPAVLELEDDEQKAYTAWRRKRAFTDADRARLRAEAASLPLPPRISVLMPVHNVPAKYLRAAVESVRKQLYPHWELCAVDDASPSGHVTRILREYAQLDPRIKIARHETNAGISAASNTALGLATGEYVALLDHDDELAEHALLRVAQAIVKDRGIDMIYTDEDKLEPNGDRGDPFFKPDWSPEYFLACMYTCHLGVYRTSLVRDVGGFRSEFDTAQDYDLALRVVSRTSRIHHIPDVLYHWRKLPSSTATGDDVKPRAYATARRALEEHLARTGREGSVERGPVPGFHRVRFRIVGRPLVSIIIPTGSRRARLHGRETTYVAQCVQSIRTKSTWPRYEIIAIDNDDMPEDLERELAGQGVRLVRYIEPFNLAAKMNLGAARAEGEHLVFLNDDIEVISPDWIESLLEYAQQPDIGAVGAKLHFPDGRLQHVGVTLLDGNPGHPFYAYDEQHPGYYNGAIVARNYSAVTGACLMTPAEVFHDLGGFSEDFPLHYNDVDYCLRVVESGKRIVFTPYARMYHHESATKDEKVPQELGRFKERWGQKWAVDPFYNPNLTTRHCDYRIDE